VVAEEKMCVVGAADEEGFGSGFCRSSPSPDFTFDKREDLSTHTSKKGEGNSSTPLCIYGSVFEHVVGEKIARYYSQFGTHRGRLLTRYRRTIPQQNPLDGSLELVCAIAEL